MMEPYIYTVKEITVAILATSTLIIMGVVLGLLLYLVVLLGMAVYGDCAERVGKLKTKGGQDAVEERSQQKSSEP